MSNVVNGFMQFDGDILFRPSKLKVQKAAFSWKQKQWIRRYWKERPDKTRDQVGAAFMAKHEVQITPEQVGGIAKELGWTLKRLEQVAKQRCELQRHAYREA